MRKATLSMMGRRFALTVAVAAGMCAGVGAAASSAEAADYSVGSTECNSFGNGRNTMQTPVFIKADDLYYNYLEHQTVYVRQQIYQLMMNGSWVPTGATGEWVYGVAYDNQSPVWWRYLSSNALFSDGGRGLRLPAYINGGGIYRIAVQIAWDASNTGAPSDRTPFMWAPGGACGF